MIVHTVSLTELQCDFSYSIDARTYHWKQIYFLENSFLNVTLLGHPVFWIATFISYTKIVSGLIYYQPLELWALLQIYPVYPYTQSYSFSSVFCITQKSFQWNTIINIALEIIIDCKNSYKRNKEPLKKNLISRWILK